MVDLWTNRGLYLMANGGLSTLDLRWGLFTGTQTGANNKDLNTVADLDAVSGISIHTERVTASSKTVTEDDANDRVNIDTANVSFAAAPGVTAQGMILYEENNGTDAGRQLIGIYMTGFPQPVDGGLNVTVSDYARLTSA